MADRTPAQRIITSAARQFLTPLGLTQRGRSRIWIADHGWWLGIVEFTPPRVAGSDMHVGAMWLWHDVDHLAFHVDGPRAGQELFRDEQQFTPVAAHLAQRAAADVTALRESFTDLQAIANSLMSKPVRRGYLWDGFDAGIAAALVGEIPTALDRFDRVLAEDAFTPWMADAQDKTRELRAIAADREAVAAWTVQAVNSCRTKLGLLPAALSHL